MVPEIRPGEVDPVKLAEAMATISKVNLDYLRRRLAQSRPVEDYLKDPDIRASVEREEEAAGMLDEMTGQRNEPHRLATPEKFTPEGWQRTSEELPVNYAEARRGAREAGEAAGGAPAVEEGRAPEEPADGADADQADQGDDDPRDASAAAGGPGLVEGEKDTGDGVDGGQGSSAAKVTDEPEDGGSGSLAEPGTEAKTGVEAEAGEREPGDGETQGPRSEAAGVSETAIAELRRAVEGLAEGMNESVRAEIAARMDAVVEGNRESSNSMSATLAEGVKGAASADSGVREGRGGGSCRGGRCAEGERGGVAGTCL